MRIAIMLVVVLWPALAAAQQYGEEPRAPAPSGTPTPPIGPGPQPSDVPPPPGAPVLPDDPAPPPASARPTAPPPGSAATTVRLDGPNVVKVHKDERGYQLLIDGKPTMVFGMNWGYMPIGQNYTYDFWGKPDDVIIEALEDEMRLLK